MHSVMHSNPLPPGGGLSYEMSGDARREPLKEPNLDVAQAFFTPKRENKTN